VKLSEDQLDLLKEVFNLGVGRAAAALAVLAHNQHEIELTLPEFKILALKDIIAEFKTDSALACISQKYEGPFKGTAHMLFPEGEILKFARIILNSNIPEELVIELESDALTEIGNILINACFESLSRMLGIEIETALPHFRVGSANELFSNASQEELVAFIKSDFNIREINLKGQISFFIETKLFKNLLELIDKYNLELMSV
jgi:chemotaxis protein CheC